MGSYDLEAQQIADRLDDQMDGDAADLVRRMSDWIGTLEKSDLRAPAEKAATRDLVVQMAKLHVRAHAHPLPEHPAALHWQITAGLYAALAARMLHHLDQSDSAKAAEITAWCNGRLDGDADLERTAEWIAQAVAGSGEVFESWRREGKEQAQRAKENTGELARILGLDGDDA